MYLELADGPEYLGQPQADLLEHMIAVPTQSGELVWVREDQLDDVPDQLLYQILQNQPHMAGIRDWFQRLRERRQERRAQKREFKLQKQAGRTEQIKTITGAVTGAITGRGQDPSGGQGGQKSGLFPQVTGQASVGVSQWWQNPMVIGGLALGAIGVTYLLTKK